MRGGVGQPGQRFLTATEKVWTKYLAFCSCYKVPTLFRILQKMSLWTGGVAISKHFTHYMYVPRSSFPYYNLTTPYQEGRSEQPCGFRGMRTFFSTQQYRGDSIFMQTICRYIFYDARWCLFILYGLSCSFFTFEQPQKWVLKIVLFQAI